MNLTAECINDKSGLLFSVSGVGTAIIITSQPFKSSGLELALKVELLIYPVNCEFDMPSICEIPEFKSLIKSTLISKPITLKYLANLFGYIFIAKC